MKKLLMIVMACYGLTATAQVVDQSKNFIYFNADSVLYAGRITLRPDVFGVPQLRADSRKVPIREFKFFNNEDGFFANISMKGSMIDRANFAERVIEGRINLFQPVVYYPHSHGHSIRSRGGWVAGGSLRSYYNKGFGDLKAVSHYNLQTDMADDAESMRLLGGYTKSMKTSKVLTVAGGASFLAGAILSLVAMERKGVDANFGTGISLVGVGTVGVTIGALTRLASYRKLENAIDAYNR